jgi:RNA polymerase sigma factor (sigma-70 family)
VKRMSRDLELKLIRKAQAGDESAMLTLLAQHERFIYKVAIKTKARGCDVDDLLQVGRMAMIQSIRSFDPRFKAKLTTWAYRIIAQKCQCEAYSAGVVRLPLCAKTVDPEAAAWAMQGGMSLDVTVSSTNDQATTLGALVPDAHNHVAEICAEEHRCRVRRAVRKLPPREQDIVTRRMAGETLKEIGDSQGVVKERIRQLEGNAWKKLREWLATPEDMEPKRKAKRRNWKSVVRGNRPPSVRAMEPVTL